MPEFLSLASSLPHFKNVGFSVREHRSREQNYSRAVVISLYTLAISYCKPTLLKSTKDGCEGRISRWNPGAESLW